MKSALIVIDMQKDFCYPDGSLFGGEHIKNIFEPVNRAVQEARRKMPVIFTQDWHRKDDVEFKIWPPHCIADTRGAEIIDEINVADEDYFIRKRRYSAFFATDLDLTLRELGIEKLYLTGVLTNICVLHTAGDAALRGYKVSVIKDCTAALTDYDYEYALHHMKNVFNAEIITLNDFLGLL